MVTVAANNLFQFTPNTITAAPGDMVAFNFVAQVSYSCRGTLASNANLDQNHSVASSSANRPCQPEANAIFSDFQPIADPNAATAATAAAKKKGGKARAGALAAALGARQAGNTPMFMVPVTDTQPMYIYCSQAQHCQQGMVMVINPPNAAAVTKYQAKAAKAQNNVSPTGGLNGGTMINNAAGTNPAAVLGATLGDAAPAKQGGKAPAGKAAKAANPLAALVGGAKKGN